MREQVFKICNRFGGGINEQLADWTTGIRRRRQVLDILRPCYTLRMYAGVSI